MEERVNIAELLRDCPKGMELDCVMYDNVKFDYVLEGHSSPIKVDSPTGQISLDKYGCYSNNKQAKCVIFPKGKTTWEGFIPPREFNNGDVVVDDTGAIFLYKQIHTYYEEPYADFYCGLSSQLRVFIIKTAEGQHCGKISSLRYATEEEKEELFKAIKDKGYKWDSKTKTFEELITPKFKVGDRIKTIYKKYQYVIKEITDTHYTLEEVEDKFQYTEPIIEDKNWELVPDKFDINTLVPFESRVLVRDINEEIWKPAIWGCFYVGKTNSYYVLGGLNWEQCIPYEGNEHLCGKRDNCADYYKTWK